MVAGVQVIPPSVVVEMMLLVGPDGTNPWLLAVVHASAVVQEIEVRVGPGGPALLVVQVAPPSVLTSTSGAVPVWPAATKQSVVVGHETPDRKDAKAGTVRVIQVAPPSPVVTIVGL